MVTELFRDTTLESGLTPGYCVNFILFADFDNDGDPDALVCRSLEPTLYFQNSGGRFENVTSRLSDLGKQFFVVSACATDVNRDGLLDVYLSTYTPGTDVNPSWMDNYLPTADKAHLNKLSQSSHPYFDDRGAANILLMNRGNGRLERAGGNVIKLWRKSYQPTWADFDNDGDDDLYVCNDFSPDTYLRNDTPKGVSANPVFDGSLYAENFPGRRDGLRHGRLTSETTINDGDLDLFVSNMYSKAGNRIIDSSSARSTPASRFPLREATSCIANDDGSFRQDAAPDAPETRTGWSFGGQFADFNNDGHPRSLRSQRLLHRAKSSSHRARLVKLLLEHGRARRPHTSPKDISSVRAPGKSPLLNFQLRVEQDNPGGPRIPEQLPQRQRAKSPPHRSAPVASPTTPSSAASTAREDARSFALFDYDNDGWLDIALASTSFPRLRVFRNRFSEIGNHEKGRLVRLNLIGTTSNRDAAGAVVIAHTSKTKRAFRKNLGQGLSSQNSPSIFITVPPKDSLENLTVHWPSGKITNYKPTGSETVISITE